MRKRVSHQGRGRSSWAQSVRSPRPMPNLLERALIWIEMEPLLEKERLHCERALHDLEVIKEKLNRFRSQSEPAYSRWFHSLFGEQVTRLRDLEFKAAELEQLIVSVKTESVLMGCSEKQAYEQLMNMRHQMERFEEDLKEKRESEFESDASAFQASDDLTAEFEEFLEKSLDSLGAGLADLSAEEYADIYEVLKRKFRADILGRNKKPRGSDRESSDREKEASGFTNQTFDEPVKADPQDARRKQIYRTLARQLHPDVNDSVSEQQKELWYEVQAAYESKNLEGLETLAAIAEGGPATGFSKIKSVSRLQSIWRDFESKLRSSQKALRQVKKQAAWNFLETQAHPRRIQELTSRIERELSEATDVLEQEVESYERRIERWKKVPPPVRRRSSQSSRKVMTQAEMDDYIGFR